VERVSYEYDTGFRGGVHWLFDLINVGERGGVESSRVTMSVASSLRTRGGESPSPRERGGGGCGKNGKRAVEGPLSRRWIPPNCARALSTPFPSAGSVWLALLKKRSACHQGRVIDERHKSLLENTEYLNEAKGKKGLSLFMGF